MRILEAMSTSAWFTDYSSRDLMRMTRARLTRMRKRRFVPWRIKNMDSQRIENTCAPIEMEVLKVRDRKLEQLWAEFTDVPMDPETECMEEKFLHFAKGTHREVIWHWFDERYSKGVAHLLYSDGVDRTDEIAQLLYAK